MTELKTLKDIENEINAKEIPIRVGVAMDIIRKEAIKWIKAIREKNNEGYVNDVNINPCDEYYCAAIPNFIKHFFNIKEEELI